MEEGTLNKENGGFPLSILVLRFHLSFNRSCQKRINPFFT